MISSTGEYIVAMSRASRIAMRYCLTQCYKDLIKAMGTDLYGAYSPVTVFPTYKLLDSWYTQADVTMGFIEFRDAGHTSIIGGNSLGDALLDVLEAGYVGVNAKTGKQIPARPFFTNWINNLGDKVGKWYATGLRQCGLVVAG